MEEDALWVIVDELLSSDSSDSDDDYIPRGPIELRPRILRFVEDVVDAYSDAEFREHFRMNRPTFQHILALIEGRISSPIFERGRQVIPPKVQLLVTLWYFGTPDSYRSIISRFNIGKATAIRSVRRVTNALLEISNNVICWPSQENIEEIKNGFHEMGMPDVIGCIDGMHIRIPKPNVHGISYINRKGFPSILLQGICDHRLKFIHAYAGEVGSNHDATVLKRSEIWNYINENFNEKFPNNTHLLGDKAYPCLPELITPYKDNGHLTVPQRNFNFLLSRTRSTIERAFGLLQKRFRTLKDLLDVRRLDWIPKYVIACCVLHNICIMQNDIMEVEAIVGINNAPDGNDDIFVGDIRPRLLQGQAKRNRLCQELN